MNRAWTSTLTRPLLGERPAESVKSMSFRPRYFCVALALLGSLGCELGARLVASFSSADKFDLVTGDLALVDHLD